MQVGALSINAIATGLLNSPVPGTIVRAAGFLELPFLGVVVGGEAVAAGGLVVVRVLAGTYAGGRVVRVLSWGFALRVIVYLVVYRSGLVALGCSPSYRRCVVIPYSPLRPFSGRVARYSLDNL